MTAVCGIQIAGTCISGIVLTVTPETVSWTAPQSGVFMGLGPYRGFGQMAGILPTFSQGPSERFWLEK
jgi:hypothetical protein